MIKGIQILKYDLIIREDSSNTLCYYIGLQLISKMVAKCSPVSQENESGWVKEDEKGRLKKKT